MVSKNGLAIKTTRLLDAWTSREQLGNTPTRDRFETDATYLQAEGLKYGFADADGWRRLIPRDGWKIAVHPSAHWLSFDLNTESGKMDNLAFIPRCRSK